MRVTIKEFSNGAWGKPSPLYGIVIKGEAWAFFPSLAQAQQARAAALPMLRAGYGSPREIRGAFAPMVRNSNGFIGRLTN